MPEAAVHLARGGIGRCCSQEELLTQQERSCQHCWLKLLFAHAVMQQSCQCTAMLQALNALPLLFMLTSATGMSTSFMCHVPCPSPRAAHGMLCDPKCVLGPCVQVAASHGFFCNLDAVLLKLCGPFLDPNSGKAFMRIDASYVTLGKRLNFKEVSQPVPVHPRMPCSTLSRPVLPQALWQLVKFSMMVVLFVPFFCRTAN